jgi:hypothetical protein
MDDISSDPKRPKIKPTKRQVKEVLAEMKSEVEHELTFNRKDEQLIRDNQLRRRVLEVVFDRLFARSASKDR